MHHWQSKTTKNSTADDLVLLPKISQDSITENLKKRFMDDCIYTYIGNVLIAVNPFKKLSIFTQKEIGMYQGAATYENPPHIYAIADNMFRNMMIDYESQCVIISGESGAGKTVSAKFIMEYISKVSGGAGRVEQIKEIILESNPLLEAFGNAKTVRNNNSSRFGKYVEIQFDRGGEPIGGKISQFLLEKSRVVLQNQNERNFHIFYQLIEGCEKDIREMFGITTPDYYSYLNQSGVYKVDDTDDKSEFKNTMHAMEVMGLEKDEQLSILSIVAAVLHLGNVLFIEGQQQAEFKDKRSLQFPCYLLGLEESELATKMASREMADRMNKEQNIVILFNRQQAFQARDALSKALYSRMFDYIVDKINVAMAINIDDMNIGILDIYGFEIFVKNGFEQFCINYVNEKLQQIFIELTLKAEQDEYVQEGVQWTPVNYFNNKVVCDLIELKNPPGVFSILDDVCATAFKVTDSIDNKFVAKMDGSNLNKDHYSSHSTGFTIFHYAGKVSYECEGFCERNRDQLSVDVIEMMQKSTNPFIVDLFPENVTDLKNKRSTLTVGSRIRKQANDLVVKLTKCQPHYIRCIKPNETKKARDWENDRVVDQVTYLGLRENIIVRRAGYAYRRPFEKFMQRYAILSKETWPKWTGDVKKGIQHLMKTADINDGQWQIGKTKLFIKDPESLFLLEERRERKFNHYAKVIQIFFRQVNATKHYLKLRERAADLFYNKKERREHSLNRNFIGDYLFLDENPQLRILIGKREKVEFSSFVWKYDRRFKKLGRDLILTDKFIYLIGRDKIKQGEKKGQFIEVIKRKLDISALNCITLSPYFDNFVVISVSKEYDSVIEIEFKTEFIMVLSKRYNEITNRNLQLKFDTVINFTVKPEGFQGGSSKKITFTVATQNKTCDVASKVQGLLSTAMTVSVPRGLPSNTKPGNRDLRAIQAILPTLEKSGIRIKRADTKKVINQTQSFMKSNQQIDRNSTDKLPNLPQSGKAKFPSMSQMRMTPVMGVNPRQSQITDEELVKSVSKNSKRESNIIDKKGPPKPPRPTRPARPVNRVEALYAYEATDTDELSIYPGDIIELVREDNEGWWTGKIGNRTGLIPSNYVKKI